MRLHAMLVRALGAAAFVAGLALAQPALAAPDGHATEAHDAGGDHAHGDEGHATGDHAEHHYFTHDDDGDGTPNWLDSDSGETYVVMKLVFHFINLLILFGIIWWMARGMAGDYLRGRALFVRKELEDSKVARDAAEANHAEIEARLVAVEKEVAEIDHRAVEQAAQEHADLVARAHVEAERIADTAQRNVRDEVTRARNELRREAVELAVQLAEGTLKANVNRQDQQDLAHQFLQSLDAEQVNADA
ncbi:MAG: F-type H+-transporting ATPase subunit b [Myxococcota bacterium]|jgi:F-type H+-transporting ATPase subunit b